MGKKPRLTKATRENILKGIRLGLTYERSAQLAGIHPRTFYLWKQKGLQGKAPIYIQFIQALKKAEVEGEAAALQRIIQAATGTEDRPGQWQAAAWILERRFPDRWSKVQKLEITWQMKIINLLNEGLITPEQVMEELGADLATELFNTAGISVGESR